MIGVYVANEYQTKTIGQLFQRISDLTEVNETSDGKLQVGNTTRLTGLTQSQSIESDVANVTRAFTWLSMPLGKRVIVFVN